MHKDTAKGMAKETVGKVQKHAGRHTGDMEMESDGMAMEGEGKVQKSFGKAKEAVRDVLKH
jgi:uncharacterized protein YjbJ (UPF0337 family)